MLHDGLLSDPFQGQGHKAFRVRNAAPFVLGAGKWRVIPKHFSYLA